ncbi:biotin/lipoyl-binding protein [Limoniibacter endophyticus]|uniref:AprE-like long alpha-helical hairpin domain-containing protein n=1 Tax=Limoniibacter endophyticus TaxID=1565040 RepID=A0A8J3GI28_9HYPH|nr:biotin/lipoyl-binding protein [Limoniibacter endophyticus]GHC69672.1 hypothetical protein GCM10010136_15750 [Limoniibacter endophyticus]
MKHDPNSRSAASIRKNLLASGALVALLVLGCGGWAVSVELSGAVMAPGQLMVETNTKKIQHREGGIVGTINVREGQRVKAGDLLLHLDETQTRANLSIVEQQLFQLLARQTRLEAQRDKIDNLGDLPPELVENNGRADIQVWLREEDKLFRSLYEIHQGQVAQLEKRIEQIGHEIEGVRVGLEASRKEFALADQQRSANEELHRRGIIPNPRIVEIRRLHAQLEGGTGRMVAELARAEAQMAESRL